MQQLDKVPEGYEPVTNPDDIPESIRKQIGVAGVRALVGLSAGDGASGKAIPEWADKKYSPQIDTYAGLSQSLNSFKDDFGGNTLTGGLENKIQSLYGGFGTEGQRDWWAAFKTNDNQIRNKLFGAALTEGEKAAYEATTVEPSMDPKEIRRNLTTRRNIVQKALQRTTKFLQAQGYNPESIAALAGEYAPELGAVPVEQAKGGDQQSGAAGAVADGSGAPPASPPDNGDRTVGGFADELPAQTANQVKLTDQQRSAFAALARRGGSAEELGSLLQTFGVNAANPADLAKLADALKKNPNLEFGVADPSAELKAVDAGDGSAGAFARGVGNAGTLGFLDEIGAVADTIGSGGTYAQNLDRRRGYELNDEQNNGLARFGGQLVGGLPVGGIEFGGARAAARAAGTAAIRQGLSREVALMQANRAFATRSALEGAGIGGVYGAGESNGGLADRAGGAAAGAAFGGATAGALSYAGGALLARRGGSGGPPALTDAQEVAAAAERQGITPFPADVGGAATRRATSAVAQTIGGAGPIVRGAQESIDSAQAVRDRIAASIGSAVGVEETGEVARRGVDAYRARTSAQIGRIYDAAEAAGGQTRVSTPEALRVLNQELQPLEESPVQGAGVGILQGLRDQLQGDVTVRGLRNARTVLREEFENNGLRRSNTERVAERVLDAATDDIVTGLRSQGQERAANLYQRADRLWRERLANIDDNLTPIVGDASGPGAKSGEQIVAALKSAMSGNNRRFASFVGTLPPEERSIVRASLISRLGQATKGQQDETGERFSLNTFLTNWNDIGNRAKTTLFGEEGRAALNDLARYAAGAKEAQRFANFSNTGGAIGNLATGATVTAGLPALAATLLAQNGAGRLLSSARFARWLGRPPRQAAPAAARAWVERLTTVARSEPAIAQDVLGLQTRLRDALGSVPARVTADESANHRASVNRQQSQQDRPAQGLQP